jgi:hypothetical protein
MMTAMHDVLEMTYSKRYAEHIITGLKDSLNQHLIKLVGFNFSPELRAFPAGMRGMAQEDPALADEAGQLDRFGRVLLQFTA